MSSDQQYPYGYQDPNVAQTWDGQTWDTHYQPTVQPGPAMEPGHAGYPGQAVQPGHAGHQGRPTQPGHAGLPGDGGYPGRSAQGAQSGQAGHAGYAGHAGQPGQQQGAGAAETAYLPAQSAGSYPLPPEVPYDHPTTQLRPVAAEAAPAAGPGYSAPTTAGHVRMTDAQRARAEGRSPIIEPGMQPAALTAVLGGLLAAGAAIGPYGLLVPLILLQAVTAAGWFRLNGMWPARQGIALAFAGGLTADVALLAAGEEHAPAAILGTLGVWVLLGLILQLRSHAGSDERQYGLMATVASSALAVVAAGHLAAAPDAVIVGCLAVAVTVLARALPLPGAASLVIALMAAAGAGVAAGGMTGMGAQGALLGLGAGVCALIGHRVASYDYPSRFVHMTAGVALPLAVAVPAVYLLGRALA
ncbi:collagen-like protein [Streptomyces ficellus]|uniref:Collagen-like protein n=1 Tax=Streptomyces ficellus TaxID=1977088 RepID=A0ABT7ZD25_9ACTN|nr:collagen-like protein [Streptomyces ficellus]MDN3297397.1 collagen-like protein [Streptomyces ficellus]